jgi:hypothetical protein
VRREARHRTTGRHRVGSRGGRPHAGLRRLSKGGPNGPVARSPRSVHRVVATAALNCSSRVGSAAMSACASKISASAGPTDARHAPPTAAMHPQLARGLSASAASHGLHRVRLCPSRKLSAVRCQSAARKRGQAPGQVRRPLRASVSKASSSHTSAARERRQLGARLLRVVPLHVELKCAHGSASPASQTGVFAVSSAKSAQEFVESVSPGHSGTAVAGAGVVPPILPMPPIIPPP